MKPFRLLSLLLLPLCLGAQDIQPRFVAGPEFGIDFRKLDPVLSRSLDFTAGLAIEFPVGKFSLGTGLLYKQYGWHEAFEYTGESELIKAPREEEPVTRYSYNRYQFQLAYYSIPLRLQYRLPCNCVYLQVGIHTDIARDGSRKRGLKHYASGVEPDMQAYTPEEQLLPLSLTLELAIGLKMQIDEKWRIFMRPTYRRIGPVAREGDARLRGWYRQLHMAFGLQRAFF